MMKLNYKLKKNIQYAVPIQSTLGSQLWMNLCLLWGGKEEGGGVVVRCPSLLIYYM